MVKTLLVMKRKKGFTREQFLKHWKEVHGPLFVAKNVPGVRRYVQNHAVLGMDDEVDGVAETWWDDLKSARDFEKWLFSSPEAKDLLEDLKFMTNLEDNVVLHAEEHIMKE